MSLFRVIYFSLLLPACCYAAHGQELCSFYSKEIQITPLGHTIKRSALTDSTYQLSYGRESANRIVNGSFYCDVPSFGRLSMYSENKDFIFMSAGCGTACRTGYLLPLNPDSEIKVIHDWLQYDLKKNIVVGFDYDFTEKDMIIKVFDLNKDKEMIYKPPIACDRAIPINCIKDLEIETDYIKINWYERLDSAPFIISLKD